MTEYYLIAYRPYEREDCLFQGTEDGLREFIKSNVTYGAPINGREFKNVRKICGYLLDDLSVLIEGPDVGSYLE